MVLASLSFRILSSQKFTIENQKIFSIIYCMLKKILASIFWLLALACMQILYQLQLCKFYTNILCMQELYQNPSHAIFIPNPVYAKSIPIISNMQILYQASPVCKKHTKFRTGTEFAGIQKVCQDSLT